MLHPRHRSPLKLTILAATALLALATANDVDSSSSPPPLASLTIQLPSTTTTLHAGDNDEHCPEWASNGECDSNPDFMLLHCASSCGVADAYSPHPGVARVYP